MIEQISEHASSNLHHILRSSLELPCGAVLKNRLAKSAMSDSLGDGEGDPTEAQVRLYERWAEGGAAVSIIGEVQGDPRYPEKPGNLVFSTQSDRQAIQSLISRAVTKGSHLWPQLGHAGALSHLPISKPKGPSALDLPGLQCAGMSKEEAQELPAMYARSADFAKTPDLAACKFTLDTDFCLVSFYHHCSTTAMTNTAAQSKHDAIMY